MEARRPAFRAALLSAAVPVARDTWRYSLTLEAPLPFRAGQFVNLAVPDAIPRGERSYSVWSSPADPTRLDLLIKLLEGGAASEYLRRARVGDTLAIRGPFGVFTLRPGTSPVVFVATGTGLAPFRSMLEVALDGRDPRSFMLYFGVRSEEDLFALDDLARYRGGLDLSVTLCLSRPTPSWGGFTGRVTTALRSAPPAPGAQFYLCGNGAMIEETRALLKEHGVDRSRVYVEKYY